MSKTYHTPFRTDNTLSDRERAFCSCTVSAAMRQSDACLKAGGKGPGCVNIYKVCVHSTGTSAHCGDNFDFEQFSDARLRAYILLRGVPIQKDIYQMTSTEMLSAIKAWKKME